MAQNMETQWQTVKALISLIWSVLFAGEVWYSGLHCLQPELLKKGS